MKNSSQVLAILNKTVKRYYSDDCPRLAAGLSFYALFSIAPLLLIVIVIVGYIYGQDAVQGEIVSNLSGIIGVKSAAFVQNLILSISQPSSSIIASTAGILLSLYGASNVFEHLNVTLNRIWNIKMRPGKGVSGVIGRKFFLVILVIGTGLFFLISLLFSAMLDQIINFLQIKLPSVSLVFQLADSLISFITTIIVFMLILRYIADVYVSWEPVIIGAVLTASLFSLSRFIISLYLRFSIYGSVYNAAASVIILLLWIYYSSQILFFGAEFTKIYAALCGKPIRPSIGAISTDDSKVR